MKVKTIFFFNNGNTAVCNPNGEQIPELQTAWLRTAIEAMRAKGAEIGEDCEILLPGGSHAELLTGVEFNWKVIP